eukprot:12104-Heterococcus_DN1.PRE.4
MNTTCRGVRKAQLRVLDKDDHSVALLIQTVPSTALKYTSCAVNAILQRQQCSSGSSPVLCATSSYLFYVCGVHTENVSNAGTSGSGSASEALVQSLES